MCMWIGGVWDRRRGPKRGPVGKKSAKLAARNYRLWFLSNCIQFCQSSGQDSFVSRLPQAFVSLYRLDLLPPQSLRLFRSHSYPSLSRVGQCMANVTHAFQFEFTIFLASNAGMWLRVFGLPGTSYMSWSLFPSLSGPLYPSLSHSLSFAYFALKWI